MLVLDVAYLFAGPLKSIPHFGASNPLVVGVAEGLPIDHVSDALELRNLLLGRPTSLLVAHSILFLEVIRQILVVVQLVLVDAQQLLVRSSISLDFPAHVGNPQVPIVLLQENQVYAFADMSMVRAEVLPNLERLKHVVAIPQVRIVEAMHLRAVAGVFYDALAPILQRLAFGKLQSQKLACHFELQLHIVVHDCVEDASEEALVAKAQDFLDNDFLVREVLLLASCFAPGFPGLEFLGTPLLQALLGAEFEPKEHALLEPGLRDQALELLVLLGLSVLL